MGAIDVHGINPGRIARGVLSRVENEALADMVRQMHLAFEDRKAAAPVVPAETCPDIDRLSTLLSAIDGDIDTLIEEMARSRSSKVRGFADELRQSGPHLATARLQLEDLRAQNEALRASGRYWYGVAKAHIGDTK